VKVRFQRVAHTMVGNDDIGDRSTAVSVPTPPQGRLPRGEWFGAGHNRMYGGEYKWARFPEWRASQRFKHAANRHATRLKDVYQVHVRMSTAPAMYPAVGSGACAYPE
jgi:hypothetical protein